MSEMKTPGRRSVVRGAAWSVPVVAVAAAAPAMAVSQCVVGSYVAGSCKENTAGTKKYYIQLCVDYNCTGGCFGSLTITGITTNSGVVLTGGFPFTIPLDSSGTGCDTIRRTFESTNLASTLTYSYTFTDCRGGTTSATFSAIAPPNCP